MPVFTLSCKKYQLATLTTGVFLVVVVVGKISGFPVAVVHIGCVLVKKIHDPNSEVNKTFEVFHCIHIPNCVSVRDHHLDDKQKIPEAD